jgi:ribosomal protein S18 acetylase RimI-like enzyme
MADIIETEEGAGYVVGGFVSEPPLTSPEKKAGGATMGPGKTNQLQSQVTTSSPPTSAPGVNPIHFADPWPAPAALAAVKSKKKAIFKADKLKIISQTGCTWQTSGISLCLESRIAAIGEAGRAVVDLLLRKVEPEGGNVSLHESMVAVNIGPHLAGEEAEAQQHVAAIMEALKVKPQVVVLDEALKSGGATWARVFRELIRASALLDFKGAVVVCCDSEPTFAMRRVCCEQWAPTNDRILQQDVPGSSFRIIEDALALLSSCGEAAENTSKQRGKKQMAAKTNMEQGVNGLKEEIRALSEHWFEEDALKVCRTQKWTLALLTQVGDAGLGSLRGYICYRYVVSPAGKKEIHIERLAVPKQYRGGGFAKMLMRWLMGEASRMPLSECAMLTTSALEHVIKFYERFGFAGCPERETEHEHDEDDDPHLFMQLPNMSLVCEA